ncbi:hypothetical protein V3564_02670 [Bartonella sp. B12(2025)]
MARTKYRAEEDIIKEDDEEEIVDVTEEDEKEDDDDIDINVEAFDEDDEEDDEGEDDEDTHKSIQAVREQERKRARALTNLEKQAKRLGVSFNAVKAIKNGMSLDKARHAVLTAASSKSGSLKVSPYVPHGDGNSKAKINAKWGTAWKAVTGRK